MSLRSSHLILLIGNLAQEISLIAADSHSESRHINLTPILCTQVDALRDRNTIPNESHASEYPRNSTSDTQSYTTLNA